MHILLCKHVNLSILLGKCCHNLVLEVVLLLNRIEVDAAEVAFQIGQTFIDAIECGPFWNCIRYQPSVVGVHLNPKLLLVLADIE